MTENMKKEFLQKIQHKKFLPIKNLENSNFFLIRRGKGWLVSF